MRRNMTLSILLFFCNSCLPPEPDKVNIIERPKSDSTRVSIVISVTAEQKVYIGSKEFSYLSIDSMLRKKIDSLRALSFFPTVVINADSSANYGIVFDIMQAASRAGAKVVANSK